MLRYTYAVCFVMYLHGLMEAWKSEFSQNYRTYLSPTVPPFAARISRVVADVQALGGETGNVWRRGKTMANYPQELAQDAVCQSHTGHITGLWFLPARPLRLNT